MFVDFPEANHSFARPKGTTEHQCGTLRVQYGLTQIEGQDFTVSVSAWKPTPDEIKKIVDGGLVYLNVYGNSHPMVSICTDKIEVKPLP